MRLLPRDEKFFDLFTSVASLSVEAAKLQLDLLKADGLHRPAIVDAIKRLEHEADQVTLEVVTRLDRVFITPLDREDIHLLASRLDDVMDLIDGTAHRVQMYRAGEAPAGAILLAEVVLRATQSLLVAVQGLEKTLDHMEDAGNVLESISIKHA